MTRRFLYASLAGCLTMAAAIAISQEGPGPAAGRTPQQRAEATRTFLGLGPEPDKAAAALGDPVFQKNCAFCHGANARGATAPSLITSDVVLDDEHGEKMVPFLKLGRPDKGMPAFGTIPDDQLKDVVEYVHLQVEVVANSGTYQIKNILVGDAGKGKEYVDAHCTSCHAAGSFDHIATKFRSPDQLQHGWVWPVQPNNDKDAITANVKMADGSTISGRVTQVSDFRITLVDGAGESHTIDRVPGVDVHLNDPLAAHEQIVMTLKNDDMHNVTAYLETLK
jgi:cytochrome c oxidase cbb3-type subunit 3